MDSSQRAHHCSTMLPTYVCVTVNTDCEGTGRTLSSYVAMWTALVSTSVAGRKYQIRFTLDLRWCLYFFASSLPFAGVGL